jgi:hypothetical protein
MSELFFDIESWNKKIRARRRFRLAPFDLTVKTDNYNE